MFRVAIRAVPRLVKQKPTFQQQRTVLAVNLSKDNGKREKVVILGSGWAANKLLQDIDKKRYEVSIISPRNHFLFTPLLPSTTVGTLDFRSIVEPMRSSKKHPEWNFFQAACLDIDANTKTLTCEERAVRESEHRVFKLNYDKLVVTIGADNNTYNIPGVQENTYFLKELDDARKIRQKIIECFERASIPGTSGEERSKLLNFVIVGGGPTGVEFAGELSDFFWEDLRHYFPTIPVNEVRFTLVEASTTILGAFHKALVDHAMVTIKRQGVDIRTHSLVKEVRKNEIHLADGTVIPCGLIVWSTGVGPRDLAKKLDWQKTKQGRFIVDDHLRVKELKDVYAAGDCAEIEANPLPATAQVAQQQGRYIAKAFNTMAKDPQATVDPFKFHYLGITTYVGSNKSLIDMDTVQMSGLIAWLGWRSAYLTRLGSWRNKLMVPLNWTRTMLFGRDISNF